MFNIFLSLPHPILMYYKNDELKRSRKYFNVISLLFLWRSRGHLYAFLSLCPSAQRGHYFSGIVFHCLYALSANGNSDHLKDGQHIPVFALLSIQTPLHSILWNFLVICNKTRRPIRPPCFYSQASKWSFDLTTMTWPAAPYQLPCKQHLDPIQQR